MSSREVIGNDSNISSSKIDPLRAPDVKSNVAHDPSSDRGAVGSDTNIDESRIEPLGGRGHYQHPLSHANAGGATGRDEDISGTKIDPLRAGVKHNHQSMMQGLDDQEVDAARIQPMGEVRDEMA
ncbi:MAG: hypothetical protein M1819_004045 [Sarea resinae]|nr:MAG: hypothetical protein M1819_004045 [Sarea resinae]